MVNLEIPPVSRWGVNITKRLLNSMETTCPAKLFNPLKIRPVYCRRSLKFLFSV